MPSQPGWLYQDSQQKGEKCTEKISSRGIYSMTNTEMHWKEDTHESAQKLNTEVHPKRDEHGSVCGTYIKKKQEEKKEEKKG